MGGGYGQGIAVGDYDGDYDVGETVAVIVTDGNALPVAASHNACFLGYIRERPVPIIAIEHVAQRPRRCVEIACSAVHQINVHPPIVVVIEKTAACPGCLRQIHVRRASIHVSPRNSACGGRNLGEKSSLLVSGKSEGWNSVDRKSVV